MITIIHQWGADYLVFDEPLNPDKKTLISPQGIKLQPDQEVKQIGRKRRSSFQLLPGFTMIYKGLLHLDNLCYAIFHCPAHDDPQLSLFGTGIQYRYAFACVFLDGQFQCFLMGRGGPYGLRDIQMDYLA